MSRRSRACEFSAKERQIIKDRDGGCIFCQRFGYSGFPATQIMHYIPRSHGGLGIAENGALGCVVHHQELDNGKDSGSLKAYLREYLESHYKDWDITRLIYAKF